MLWRVSSSSSSAFSPLPAVIAAPWASGCSHGGIVADCFTAFPGEHLVSPHPGASPVSWPFCWQLAALHNSGTVSGSYCTRDRVTFQTLASVLCMPLLKRFLHLACIRAFCRVTEFLWPFQLQRTSFLFLSAWPCWKLPACLCQFLCLHQTAGISKGCTLNSSSSSSILVWVAELY